MLLQRSPERSGSPISSPALDQQTSRPAGHGRSQARMQILRRWRVGPADCGAVREGHPGGHQDQAAAGVHGRPGEIERVLRRGRKQKDPIGLQVAPQPALTVEKSRRGSPRPRSPGPWSGRPVLRPTCPGSISAPRADSAHVRPSPPGDENRSPDRPIYPLRPV
jgi:hypothetical protein